jgi:hypothetical protein
MCLKPGAGKRKGGQFERDVCRAISLFWSDGAYDDLCWRSSGSGNKGTVTKTKNKSYWGDLVGTSPLIESLFKVFCFELKHYKDIDVTEILRGLKNNKLLLFWNQALRSAVFSKRIPVLLCKPNNFPIMLVVKRSDAFVFIDTMNKKLPFISISDKLCIFNFDSFLENVNRFKFFKLIGSML